MRRGLRWLLTFLALGLITLLITAFVVRQRSLPQIDGTLSVPGISSPVTVLRDTFGVPHFYAANLPDLAFAVGYVQAQDRLLQIDLSTHLVNGTLSEVIGEETVEMDLYHRTIALRRWGDRAYEKLEPEDRALLQAYCDGYNHFVRAGKFPLDFLLLHHTPEELTPIDLMRG